MNELAGTLEGLDKFDGITLEAIFKSLTDAKGMKLGKIAQPMRVALTGRKGSPSLFEVMSILGKDKVVRRIKAAISYIESCTES